MADTNLISYLLIRGIHTDAAREVYRKDADWIAPALWRSEFRNVVALCVQRTAMNLTGAIHRAEAAESLMSRGEHAVDSSAVLELA